MERSNRGGVVRSDAELIMQTLGCVGVYWNSDIELRLDGIRSNKKGYSVSVWLYVDGEIVDRYMETDKVPMTAMKRILNRIKSQPKKVVMVDEETGR
jgi:hypothetical protein